MIFPNLSVLVSLGQRVRLVAWSLGLPLAFLAHRAFTFSSRGIIGVEWIRFVATQLASMVTSVAAMSLAVDVLGLHYLFGLIAGIVLVPVLNYLALNRWVFQHQTLAASPDTLADVRDATAAPSTRNEEMKEHGIH